ncbi:T9SS type A sorting domain-containing protein [Saprospiraceae bacterium]|nr:T9SS type A sorting domain-containing protein [Saprospiraceae bacterium]
MTSKILFHLFLFLFPIFITAQVSFTEDNQITFIHVNEGDQRFGDFDNDGDQDLIYVGYANPFDATAVLYLNDGNGLFELSSAILEGAGYSTIDIADIDNDNDLDILIAGQGMFGVSTDLYLNDGSANFTLVPNSPFPDMLSGEVKFADFDGDGDQDIFMLGINSSWTAAITELFKNDGNGNFEIVDDSPIIKVYQGASDFSDIDNDGDLDLVVTGVLGSNFESSTNLYLNDGNGNYSIEDNNPFVDVQISTANFADIDNDGDEDLLLSGQNNSGFNTKLYENDGDGNFNLNASSPIVEVIFGACSFADVDLDNDLDLLIVGRKGAIPDETAQLYLNDGNGVFEKLANTPFTGAVSGGAQFGDVNGDGFPDIFITGSAPDQNPYSKLYVNDLMVGNSELEPEEKVYIFPNPVRDIFSLTTNSNSQELTIMIYDQQGKVILSNRFKNESELLISSKNFAVGTYILQWKDKEGNKGIIPFVKQ